MANSVINVKPADVQALRTAAAQAITDGLNGLIQGAAADIQTWGDTIAQYAIAAASSPTGSDLLPVLADQAKVLLELNRLEVQEADLETMRRVLIAVTSFIAKVVVPAAAGPLGPLAAAGLQVAAGVAAAGVAAAVAPPPPPPPAG